MEYGDYLAWNMNLFSYVSTVVDLPDCLLELTKTGLGGNIT
jgi:hypothetical protein